MPRFNPYLNFPGNAEEALSFYKTIFGGEFAMAMRFGETPEGARLSDTDKNKMMHIALPLGNNTVLMASDSLEALGHKLQAGNNFYISLNTDSREEADNIFNGLTAGGKTEMPMTDTFWGDYFGMCEDKFNIHWMISYRQESPQE